MALKPVTDPHLLTALNTAPAPVQAPAPVAATAPAAPAAPALATMRKPVTDPALLAQLSGREPSLSDEVPLPQGQAPNKPEPELGLWDQVKNAVSGDPIIDMWMHGLGTAAAGAPETIGTMTGNALVQGAAGISAPFVAGDMNDQAEYIKDFTNQHGFASYGDNARQLTEGIGEAFQPMQNVKRKLGETTLDATGSPFAATLADMIPDLATTILGAEGIPKGPTIGRTAGPGLIEAPAANLRPPSVIKSAGEGENFDLGQHMLSQEQLAGGKPGLKPPAPPINSKINDLRAADIRMRPSDVRAATPGARNVPGTFREKFADAPELKTDLTLHNQQRYTDLAAEELGVKDLTEGSLAEAEKPAAAVYDMAESVLRDHPVSRQFENTLREALDTVKAERPRGEVPTVTGTIGMLRRRSSKRIASGNPESEAAGYADRNMADALEDAFGKELEAAGEPQLVKQYQDARQKFAKIHDVRDSVRADHIDAEALQRLDKKFPNRLTGRLKLIAEGAEYVPNVSKHSLKTAARAEEGVKDTVTGNIKDLGKKLIRKIPGVDVGKPGFQNKFGKPDKAAADSYGRKYTPTPKPAPKQGEMDLESLMLEAPPGEAGGTLPSTLRKQQPGSQPDMFGEALGLEAPPGEVGIRDPGPATDLTQVMIGDEPLAEPITDYSALSLNDILGLSEPLVRSPKPRRGKK